MLNRREFLINSGGLIAATMLFGCHGGSDQQGTDRPADLIVINASIFTSNNEQPWAEALAVRDERFISVGTNESVLKHAGPDTEVINAYGEMVTPGFVDNHCHTLWINTFSVLPYVVVIEADSLVELGTLITNYVKENPDVPIVMGLGFHYDYTDGKLSQEEADKILSDRPLIFGSYGGNTGCLNTRADKLMQEKNPIKYHELVPEIDKNTGKPTGILLEFHPFNYLDFFKEELGQDLKDRIFAAMESKVNEALSYGVTTVHDVQIYESFLDYLFDFHERGGLENIRARIAYYIGWNALEDEQKLIQDLDRWRQLGQEHSDAHFYLGDSVKLYIEGVPNSHTSLMLDPYSDVGPPDYYGKAVWSEDDFKRVIGIIDKMGIQACTHAIGDGGIRRVINSYGHAQKVNGKWDSRHRIEHADLPSNEDIPRMAALGIYAATQPMHLIGDKALDNALGPARLERLHPWRSYADAGVNISFGSDWAAGLLNPIYSFIMAVTRINYKGTSWGPEQAIDIETAIRHYTIDSARALKLEKEGGSIEPGKYADFVLFSFDLEEIVTPEFWDTYAAAFEEGLKNDEFALLSDYSYIGPYFGTERAKTSSQEGEGLEFVHMTFVGGKKVYCQTSETSQK